MKKILITLFLLIGMASSINYLPETTMKTNTNLTFSGGNIYLAGGDIDSWVGDGRDEIVNFDGYIRQSGSSYIATVANGTQIGSADSDLGVVTNALIDHFRGETTICRANILIDITGTAYLVTPIVLYQYLGISGIKTSSSIGMGSMTTIETGENDHIFETNGSHQNRYITIENLQLISNRTGTDYYTVPHVLLDRTGYSYISNVFTNVNCDASATVRGGISFQGKTDTTNWLNVVEKCHLTCLEFNNTHDSWIQNNIFCSWNASLTNLRIISSHNLKITNNHFVIPTVTGLNTFGMYTSGSISYMQFINNFIEPQDAMSLGTEWGIYSDATMYECGIIENVITNMGRSGFNFPGGLSYSDISHNRFLNCNSGNSSDARCISFGSGSYNTLTGNIGINTVSTTKGAFAWGTDYTSYTGNIIYGNFNDDISYVGTGSIETGTISTLL